MEGKNGRPSLCERFLPACILNREPENKTDDEWTWLHRQVCGYIWQWVDDNVLNHIIGEKHARTLWSKLEQLYAQKTGNSKLFFIKQLIALRYRDGNVMTDHLNAFQGIINQLSEMGVNFDEEIQGLWILGTLPDSWETFRTSLSNSAPNGIISLDFAKNGVLNEEMRRKSQVSTSHSDALVMKNRGRSQSRSCKSRGSKGKYANVECYHCGELGHTKRFCRKLKKENKKNKGNGKKKEAMAMMIVLLLLPKTFLLYVITS